MRLFRISVIARWMLVILGSLTSVALWSQQPAQDFTKSAPIFPNVLAPYQARHVPEANLTNSTRIGNLIQDGKLKRSLSRTTSTWSLRGTTCPSPTRISSVPNREPAIAASTPAWYRARPEAEWAASETPARPEAGQAEPLQLPAELAPEPVAWSRQPWAWGRQWIRSIRF